MIATAIVTVIAKQLLIGKALASAGAFLLGGFTTEGAEVHEEKALTTKGTKDTKESTPRARKI
jgi:hypothetical protein